MSSTGGTSGPSSGNANGTAPGVPNGGTALLATLAMAQFMVVLDFTIVNVALPSIQHGLHVATTTLQWLVSAYAVTFGGFLLLGGRLADVFGRARLYRIGLCVFVLASISGGLAVEPRLLIASRAVQGLGASLLAPAGLSLLVTSWPDGEQRSHAARYLWGGRLGRLRRRRRDRRPARRGELAARLLRQRPGRRGPLRGVVAPPARRSAAPLRPPRHRRSTRRHRRGGPARARRHPGGRHPAADPARRGRRRRAGPDSSRSSSASARRPRPCSTSTCSRTEASSAPTSACSRTAPATREPCYW